MKVILWDVDGTLLNFSMAEKYAIRKCFEIFGLGECTDEMLARYTVINHRCWERLERGELTREQVLLGRYTEFFQTEGIAFEDVAAFNAEYQVRLGEAVFFNDDGYELVKSLKGKVKQYAVTNGSLVAQERKLRLSGLDQLFDGIFISEVLGIDKPSIVFFEKVWEQIGIYASDDVVIIGDSLTSDIQGGNNADIQCWWYNPAGKMNTTGLRVDHEIRNLQEIRGLLDV